MKRMKKLISIRSIPVLALALLIVLGSALEAVPPTKVSGSGGWSATYATNWIGEVKTLTIGAETFEYVQYVAMLSELSGPNDEGVYQGTILNQYFHLSGGDVFTYFDKVTLEPTGEPFQYTLNVRSGTVSGSVNGRPIAGGRLRIQGTVEDWPPIPPADPDPGTPAWATFEVSGSITY